MKRKTMQRSVDDHLTSGDFEKAANDDSYDSDMERLSASYYERSWKRRLTERQGDMWIAGGLYLMLCSVAFVFA